MSNVYSLTKKGKEDFSKFRDNVQLAQTEGYLVLDHLYEMGPAIAKEISAHTGLSSGQVKRKVEEFGKQGLVEVLANM